MTDTQAPFSPPPKYIGFNMRMLASMIDLGIVALLTTTLVDWLMEQLFAPADMNKLMEASSNPEMAQNTSALIATLWNTMIEQHLLERIITQNLLDLACVAAYTLPFWFRYSSTPGKMLFGYTIRDAKTGEPMTREQSVKRFLAYVIAFLPLTLGFVWIIFNKKRQGLHDLLANTMVIKKPKEDA